MPSPPGSNHGFRQFLRARAGLLGLAVALGAGSRFVAARPPEKSLPALAEALGRESSAIVDAKDIAWEDSPGFWSETFFGRSLLFLGRKTPNAPRDLFRAKVRVTLDGQMIAVRALRNLTETPLGDDVGLELRGERATFATLAYGKIQSVSVLELPGIRTSDRPSSLMDRALLAITSFQQTGSAFGIGRTDIVLEKPAERALLSLEPKRLLIALGDEGPELSFDCETRKLSTRAESSSLVAHAVPQAHGSKPLVLWAVDTVRAEVGNEPIAWLENKTFGAQDSVKRAAYSLFNAGESRELKADAEKTAVARVLDGASFENATDAWPPPNVPSIWKSPKPGEGVWAPVTLDLLKPLAGLKASASPPPYFFRTKIRPDPKRPYSEVLLIAMDMRQLELGMQAGYEDPKPSIGAPGEGRLPSDPAVYRRVVATFNGAFKSTHGQYGMMVNKRVLLPPVKGGATIVVTRSGDTGLGSWPDTSDIPEDLVAYRQNLDPLVEDGVANPTGRHIWGWALEGESSLTYRSAVCVTSAGHLYYAWASEIDGPTLGRALRQAGCSYGMHLDMNPAHTGFVFTDILDLKKQKAKLKLADSGMQIAPDKFVRSAPKDFFYVMVRSATPRDPAYPNWAPDAGTQPPPAWSTGIFSTSIAIGSVELSLTRFERGSLSFRLRSGTREAKAWGTRGVKLSLDEHETHEVLAAVGLGHGTDSSGYGLSFGADALIPLRRNYATLVVDHDGTLRLEPAGAFEARADEDGVQLPLLAQNGELEASARERGDLRQRGALCVDEAGTTIVARARHDSSDPLVTALVRAGCKLVVALDRGSHHPAFLQRTGTADPPLASYETSVLYALGRPLLPHAFRWRPVGVKASTQVSSYDVGREQPDHGGAAAELGEPAASPPAGSRKKRRRGKRGASSEAAESSGRALVTASPPAPEADPESSTKTAETPAP